MSVAISSVIPADQELKFPAVCVPETFAPDAGTPAAVAKFGFSPVDGAKATLLLYSGGSVGGLQKTDETSRWVRSKRTC